MNIKFSCCVVAFAGIVKLNVTVFDSSTARSTISCSSLILKLALYTTTKTLSSLMFPRLITSTVYFASNPGVIFVGPFTFLITIIFSSCSMVIVASSLVDAAFRLVQMLSLFASYSFA